MVSGRTIELWHDHVEEQEIDGLTDPRKHLDSVFAVLRGDDGITQRLEHFFFNFAEGFIVFREENGFGSTLQLKRAC